MICLDIEVYPDPALPELDWQRMRGDGRITDPVKQEAKKKEQAKTEWYSRATDTVRNVVLCAVLSIDEGEPIVIQGGVDKGSQVRLFEELDSVIRPETDSTEEPIHTLCGHYALEYDFRLLSIHALRHGFHALARVLMPRSRWNSEPYHIDTYRYYQCSLWKAALHFGHVHPSPDAGSMVAGWVESGSMDLVVEHCIDDVLATNKIAWPLVRAGIAKRQR